MKLERSKNAVRNIKVGILCNLIRVFFPFMLRTILIHTVGVEYLGLNGLFSSILSVLSLAELGFGSAMVFYMYRAIANDDTQQINALLYAYRKNHKDMMRMYFVYMWAAGWCTICMLCLYQPFMKIWAGEQFLFPFLKF